MPTSDLVDDYIAAAESQGSKIVAVIETHLQADHVSGLPELVERTGATAYMPEGSGAEFEHKALADGERDRARQHGDRGDRHPRPRPGAPLLPGHRPPPRRRALVRPHRRLAARSATSAGRICTPRARRASRSWRGPSIARSTSGSWRSPTTCSSTRPTTPGRSAAADSRGIPPRGSASSAGTTRALAADSEDEFVEARPKDIPPAPEHQAEIVAANRSGESSAAPVEQRAGRAGAARELAQFTLLVAVNALVGAMVGLERSTLPLIGENSFGVSSTVAVLSFIVAFGLAKSFTNLAPARSPSGSGGGGC